MRKIKKYLRRGQLLLDLEDLKTLIIAPSKPKSVAGGTCVGGGCYASSIPRACTLHQSGLLHIVNRIQSRYNGVWHSIRESQPDLQKAVNVPWIQK